MLVFFFYVFLLKALKGSTFQGSHQDKKHCQRDIMMVGPYYMSFIPLLVLSLSLLIRLCVLLQLNKPALVNQKRRTPPLPQIQEQAVGTETKGRI